MENTRARILTAAAQLFEQQGYRSVSMRAIAAQLGISVGNLTYHFPHKQDIATALAEQELTAIILPEEATLPALDGYLRRMLLSLVDHARMFDDPLLFEDLPGCQQENADRITRLQQNLERLLSQLRQQGRFRQELRGQTLQDVITLIMFPVLLIVYARLARREEIDAIEAFGDAYRSYRERTPAFIPRLR